MWSRMTPRRWLLAVGALVMLLVVASVIALFFIADIEAYDPKKDREKGVVRKAYEKVVEGVSKFLQESPPRRGRHP